MTTRHKNTALYLTLLTLIAIGFLIVSFFTPLHGDDYNYSFINSPAEIRAINPWPGFMSAYTDNFAGVARLVPHLLVGLFTDITGKQIFNLFSTAGFILLCFLLARNATADRTLRLPLALLAATLIWFVIPGIFEACLWMAGACNYLFVTVIILLFYHALTSDSHGRSPWWSLPLWVLFGFATGWTNEGFTVGLSAGCGLYYILLHRDQLTPRRIAMLGGLFAGTLLICLTPFNLYRFMLGHSGGTSLLGSVSKIALAVSGMTNIRISFLLIIMTIALLTLRVTPRKAMLRFAGRHTIIITAWLISLIFIIMAGHTTGHSRFPTEFYALMLLLSLTTYALSGRLIRISSVIGGMATVLSFVFVIPHTRSNHEAFEDMRRQIIAGDTIVKVDNIYGNCFTSRYAPTIMATMYNRPVLDSKYLVSYYGGTPGAIILTHGIYDMLQQARDSINIPMTDDDTHSTWINITGMPDPHTLTLNMRPVNPDELSFIGRMLMPYMDRYSMCSYETDDFTTLDILGRRWIVIKNYPFLTPRIESVDIR